MQDDKQKRIKKAQEEFRSTLKSAPTESSNKAAKNYAKNAVRNLAGTPDKSVSDTKYLGRDYPLSPTPKMGISPLDGKVYIYGKPVSSIKKNK